MINLTAVELGADTCTFARTSARRGGEVRLSAAEILDPAAFPGRDAFTLAVRQTRRALRLPRRCRVVLWGLPDGANRKDAAVKPLIEPLTAAGFRVERVVTPCNALAALARLRMTRGEGSTCWLAINRGGVAIVVVRPGKLLYAHSFAWDSTLGASGSQARLLQRYSLVSFLSPEVKRAMAEAHKSGTPVDAVITCGNLPDLRSLTMPLIEELDVEVETLDTLEGLVVKPQLAETLSESASAIRLACAAAIARGTRPWDGTKQRSRSRLRAYVRAAVFTASVVGVGYARYLMTRPSTPPSVPSAANAPAAAPRIEVRGPKIEKPGNDPRSSVPDPRAAAVPKTTPPAATPLKPPVVVPPPPVTKTAAASAAAPAPRIDVRDPKIGHPGNDPRSSVPDPRAAAVPKTTPPAATPLKPPVVVPPPPVTKTAAASAAAPAPRIEVRDPKIGHPGNDPRSSVPDPRPAAGPKAPPSTPLSKPPVVTPPAPAAKAPVVSAPVPAPKVEVRDPRIEKPGNNPRSPGLDPRPPPRVAPGRGTPSALNTPTVPTDKPEADSRPVSSPVRSAQATAAVQTPGPGGPAAPRAPMPPLLKDAVPRVTAILVSSDRRLATVDGGQIIGIGDLLGRRTVVGMDERSVVFQEPSGVQIRVGLGGRLLGVERAVR